MRTTRLLCCLCVVILPASSSVFGATSTVSTVSQLESALAVALSNREDDVINVEPGTYYLESTLTYNAPTNENKSLTVQCVGGGAVIDAGTIESGTYRGMYITTSGSVAHVTLNGLTVRNGHTTSTDTASGMGAGLFVWLRYGNVRLQNCIVRNNIATELFNPVNAAGAYLRVDNSPGAIIIQNCVFSNNFAKGTGGGAYITPGYGVSVNLLNNLFTTNGASTMGGGAYIYMISGALTMDNNTFTSNWTGYGSGGGGAYIRLFNDDCTANLRNNILWSNRADNGIGPDVYFEDDPDGNGVGATVNVYNCDFSDIDYHVSNRVFQGSNTNADPLLTSDYHLRAASPCIDTGTNLAWMTNAVDMDGQGRIFNDRVDMGVDEAAVAGVSIIVRGTATSVWDTVVDAECQLRYSTNLVSDEWQDVGSTATATSRRIVLVDTNATDAMRGYLLEWVRP